MLVRSHDVAIPLLPRFSFDKLPTQDITLTMLDGTKHKRKIQIASTEDPVTIIRVIDEVLEAIKDVGLDGGVARVVAIKKSTLKLCLLGSVRTTYAQALSAANTNAGWNQSMKDFLSSILQVDEDFRMQKDYMKSLTMPPGKSCAETVGLLRCLNECMRYLPQTAVNEYPTPLPYTNDELREYLLSMVPSEL
jgi:hypothetical protein